MVPLCGLITISQTSLLSDSIAKNSQFMGTILSLNLFLHFVIKHFIGAVWPYCIKENSMCQVVAKVLNSSVDFLYDICKRNDKLLYCFNVITIFIKDIFLFLSIESCHNFSYYLIGIIGCICSILTILSTQFIRK